LAEQKYTTALDTSALDNFRSNYNGINEDKVPADLSHFYVITPISNPARYTRRYELYRKFAGLVRDAGVNLITVEQAFGHRQFMVTEPNNPMHVQVRSHEELWLKENLINIGIARACEIDKQAREVAWVDADCFPMCPMREWFSETWHSLQHFEFTQMWRHLVNFGPKYEVIGEPQPSFMHSYREFGFKAPVNAYKGPQKTDYAVEAQGFQSLGRPGLAWAASVEALNRVGGLVDFCILGSGDWHMAHALIGAMTEQTTLVGTIRGHGSQEFKNPNYTHALLDWQEKCERWIKRDVGYVDTTVGHWWHGKYKNRKYGSRGQILIENDFNPYTDIKYDSHGMLMLETWEPRQMRLRDLVRDYFATRNEDSIDIY
jgi:hypothetical protein